MDPSPDPTAAVPAALLARLQALEDAEAARNHLHAYAAALDAPTPAGLAALFTPDGVLHVGTDAHRGHDAVAEFYRSRTAADPSEKRHFITSPRTRSLGPGVVEVASYFLWTARADARSVLGWGTYLDEVRVVDGVARFAAKTITPHLVTDLAAGWAALSGSAAPPRP